VRPLFELVQGAGVSDLWVQIGGREAERRRTAVEGGGDGAGGVRAVTTD
jgi:hypothetical protein